MTNRPVRIAARGLAITLLGTLGLVACGDEQEACAAPPPAGIVAPVAQATSRPQPRQQSKQEQPKQQKQQPGQQRTSSKVQDTTKPPKVAIKTSAKPTSWSGYNDRVKQKNWSQPYHKGYPVPQQPIIINQYGHDYRTYPGYYGYYPIGVWPYGYGQKYGCVADEEQDLEKSPPPSPAPTVTVTAPPSAPAGTATPSSSGTPTPSGTP